MGPSRLPKEGETWAGPWRMTHRADKCSQPRPALTFSQGCEGLGLVDEKEKLEQARA